MAKAVTLNAHIRDIADVLNDRLKTVDPISVTTIECFQGNVTVLLLYKSRLEGSKKNDETKTEREDERRTSDDNRSEPSRGRRNRDSAKRK